jgi:hypothetical protein
LAVHARIVAYEVSPRMKLFVIARGELTNVRRFP